MNCKGSGLQKDAETFSKGISQDISVLVACDPMARAGCGSGHSSPQTTFGALRADVGS